MYNEFVAKVKSDGLARQNRFYIEMSAPSIKGPVASRFSNERLKDLSLLCRSITIPGVNVATNELRTTGEITNLPYDRTFGDVNFVFYVDRGMVVREMFEEWINSIQDRNTRQLGWYNDFTTTMKVVILPRSETNKVYTIQLNECFPKSIGTLNLDNGNNDIMTIDVTMSIKNYNTQKHDYVPQAIVGGSRDSFSYVSPAAPKKFNGTADTFTYIPPKNTLPGQPGAEGASPRSLTDVIYSTLDSLNNNYSGIVQSFQNDFFGFQNLGINGEAIINGVGVPLNIGGAFDVLRRQTLQTSKSAVQGVLARKTGIRVF